MPHTPVGDDDSDYTENKNVRKTRAKRRRISTRDLRKGNGSFVFPLDLLSEALPEGKFEEENCFEEAIQPLLDDLLSARREYEENLAEIDESVRITSFRRCGIEKLMFN
jgi:hypothetical protein